MREQGSGLPGWGEQTSPEGVLSEHPVSGRFPLPPALALFLDKLVGYSLFAYNLMVVVAFVCLKGAGGVGATSPHVEKPGVSFLWASVEQVLRGQRQELRVGSLLCVPS